MSSIRSERPLRIEPQRSLILSWFLIINFSGVTAILFLTLPLLYAALLLIPLWGYFYWLYREYILMSSLKSVHLLKRESDGVWLAITADGVEHEVQLMPSTYIHSHLIILLLKSGRQRFTLPLVPDSISAESFRALSVRLRTGSEGY